VALRLGLLSTANINGKLLGGVRATEEVQVVAVASRDMPRAAAYAAEHGIAGAHGSYDDLLADPEVDAVYVPLPNSMHVEWSIRALEAGKHVLCEKPLTRRPEEAEAAFDAADRAGRVLMEGFMWRHTPQTRRVESLLAEGAVGEVRLVRASFSFSGRSAGDVRLSATLDGGALMDVGCYCVSALRLAASAEPVACLGRQVAGGEGVDIRFAATLAFPGGALGQLDCGMDLPRRAVIEIVGSEGELRLPDPWFADVPRIELRRGDEESVEEPPHANPYACELEDLAAAARGERAPLLGREDAVAQARAIAALYASAEVEPA
jgi:predicted dehydrogenase